MTIAAIIVTGMDCSAEAHGAAMEVHASLFPPLECKQYTSIYILAETCGFINQSLSSFL